jgi:hypothetical protein
MNIYENLQIVWSQFCTNLQLFVYIRTTLKIYLFIGIWICCQRIQTNSYLVTFGYSQYSVQHSMNNPEDRKTTIRRYLVFSLRISKSIGLGKDLLTNSKLGLKSCQFRVILAAKNKLHKVDTTYDRKKFYNIGTRKNAMKLFCVNL